MNTMHADRVAAGGQEGAYLARGSDDVSFPKGRTALLLIDPVNDFLSEGDAAWEMTTTTVKMNNVVKNLRRATAAFKALE